MNTKRCDLCREMVSTDQFNKNKAKPDGLTNCCKPCMKVYQADHYRRNKKHFMDKALERQKERYQYWRDLKDNKPCADCKVVHRYFALDYDHRDASIKVDAVSLMASHGLSIKTIEAEIAKCDLVCATCHRYRTYNRKMVVPVGLEPTTF